MKIGMNMLLWTGHVREEHFDLFGKFRATGFDGAEIPIFDLATAEHYRRIGRAAADAGLELTASSALSEPFDPLSADPAARRLAADRLEQLIERAHDCGARLLVGPLFQVLGKFSGEAPTQAERDRAAEVHRMVARTAEDAGVEIALEPLNRFEAHLLNTVDQTTAYLDDLDSPWFGALFDTFHAHIEEKDPVEAAGALHRSGRLSHVHISENDRGAPGRGHAKLRETIERLKTLGYDRWLTIEAFGSAVPELAAATRVWRAFFADPQEVYGEGFRLIRDAWDAAPGATTDTRLPEAS